MFKFNELKSIHLEITNNCQASCPMCSRNVHGGRDNPNLKLNDWSLDEFKQIISQEVLDQVNGIYFCGNFGDPILNNDLQDMCEYATVSKPNLNLRIHTNGGARSSEWWAKLASVLPEDHRVIFGIDGLEDTHHLYRVGTTYTNVIKHAKAFIDAGGKAEWVFIKFKHNEHQVDEARARAEQLGFLSFNLKNSTRFIGGPTFEVRDKNDNALYNLEPPSDNKVKFIDATTISKINDWAKTTVIECKAIETKEVYIDAHKKLYPCCFLASSPYYYTAPDSIINDSRNTIVSQHSDLISSLGGMSSVDTTAHSLQSIIDSEAWQTVWHKYWEEKKLLTCARICGVAQEQIFSKPHEQFVGKDNFNE